MAGGFISDAEMAQLEAEEAQVNPAKRFISDAEMEALSGGSVTAIPASWGNPRQQRQAQTVDQLLGQDATPTQAAGRIAVGGLSRFLPFGDEIVAGGSAGIDALRGQPLGESYDRRLEEVRGYQEAFGKQSPVAGGVVDVAGALALPIKSKVPGKTTFFGKVGQSTKEGAALGGLYGFAGGEGSADRLSQGGQGAALGGALSGGATGTFEAIARSGPSLKSAGQALRRKALGTRASDYTRTADEIGVWDIIDDEVATSTKRTLDDLIERKVLGDTTKASKLSANAVAQQSKIGQQVDDVIQNYDAVVGAPVSVKFDRARQYVNSGKVPADEVPTYLAKIDELENAVNQRGGGTLAYLQQQKIALGNLYEVGNEARNGYYKSLYHDLQMTIEKAAPGVKPLNRELTKIRLVRPILDRNLGSAENQTVVSKTKDALRTSGGSLTTPMIIATGAGGGAAMAGPVGAVAGGALTAAATPWGSNALGKGLIGAGNKASVFSPLGERAPSLFGPVGGLTAETQDPGSESQGSAQPRPAPATSPVRSSTQALPRPSTRQSGGRSQRSVSSPNDAPASQETQVFNYLLDAVKTVESGGNPRAVSPANAKGAYQFTDATAKDYGLSDPFNETEARKAAERKIKADAEFFGGDVQLALAAYNAGRGRISKLLKETGGDSFEDIRDRLPRETQQYVPKVAAVFAKLMEQKA